MKRQIEALIIFVILSIIGCFVWSFFIAPLPNLLPGGVFLYKISNMSIAFLTIFPTIICTAFLIGSSLNFGKDNEESEFRFSARMFKRYKVVLILSLVSIFFMTLGTQVFLPTMKTQLAYLQKQPELFDLYCELALHYKVLGQDELAYLYIKRASEIYPENNYAAELLSEFEITSGFKLDKKQTKNTVVKIDEVEDLKLSSLELLEKSKESFEKKDFLNAHYYAKLASQLAEPKDLCKTQAEEIASTSWKKLSEVSNTADKISQKLFEEKLRGYNALMRGDVLEAYYIFMELKKIKYIVDPDVERYFALSEQKLKQQFFFTDECNNLKKYESVSDLHFSIKHKDGCSEVFFIRGATDIQEQGNHIRFLRDFYVIYFDKNGNFIKSISVPYAKMFSVEKSMFPQLQQKKLNLPEKAKYVPLILLNSVNRNSNRGINKPLYKYANSVVELPTKSSDEHLEFSSLDLDDKNYENYEQPQEISFEEEKSHSEDKNISSVIESSFLVLPMEYNDFNYLSELTGDAQNMNLFSLFKFIPLAQQYGYSFEAYNTILQERTLYPFSCLLLLLFLTIMSWNYRVNENAMFKLKWILTVPFIALLMHIFMQTITYILRLVNFNLICIVGYNFSLIFGLLVNLFLFIVISTLFLSRKYS